MENKGYKRRNYFIDKKFQLDFIIRFCMLVIMGGLLTIGILYFLTRQSTTVAIMNSLVKVRTTADFILPILVQTVAVVSILVSLATIVVLLFVSHKIAGPIFRFKKVIENLEKGDFSSNFYIRRLDQFQDLALVLNNMILRVKGEINQLKDILGSLNTKLNDISDNDVSESKVSQLAAAKRASQEARKIINRFNT